MTIKYLLDRGFEEVTHLGDFIFSLFIIVSFFFLGEINLSSQLLFVFILTFVINFLLKFFFFKERPRKERYHDVIEKVNASSFPSMHAMRTSAFFIIFINFFKDIYFSIFLFIMFLFVVYSRIYTKKHYLSDILFGTLFGLIIGIITILI